MSFEVPKEVNDLATKLTESATVGGTDETVRIDFDKSTIQVALDEILPEGMDHKSVAKVTDAIGVISQASALAGGRLAIQGFKKSKKTNMAIVNVPICGHDKINHVFHRETSGIKPSDGKPWSRKAALKTKVTLSASSTGTSKMRNISLLISDEAAKAY